MADIRHSLQIGATPEAIFPLISTASGFAQWWSQDVTQAGDEVELGFFNRSTIYRLRKSVSRPPLEIDWLCESGKEWAGTRLIFHLQPVNSGTLVRFTHSNWESESDYFISCTTVWGELMFRLRAAAEGQPQGPLFLANSLAY